MDYRLWTNWREVKMPRKLKFRPKITRVKLNPEQAVLTCTCYDRGDIAHDSATSESTCLYTGREFANGRCLTTFSSAST